MSSMLCSVSAIQSKLTGGVTHLKLPSLYLSIHMTNEHVLRSPSSIQKDLGLCGMWPFPAETIKLFSVLFFCPEKLKRICGGDVISGISAAEVPSVYWEHITECSFGENSSAAVDTPHLKIQTLTSLLCNLVTFPTAKVFHKIMWILAWGNLILCNIYICKCLCPRRLPCSWSKDTLY